MATHGLPDEEREWSLEGVTKKKRAANDNEPGVDRISTCPKCFTIHLPAPACPTCGHVYPVKERKVDQADGELVELGADQLEALRRQKRAMQGQAQTVEQLIAQGISRGRALKIVQARQAKAALIGEVFDAIQAHRERTGLGPHQAFGVTIGDIRHMKPKELHALRERVAAAAGEIAA